MTQLIHDNFFFIVDELEDEKTITVSRKFNDFVIRPILKVNLKQYTVKALINAQAFIRIITYHRERGRRLLETSQLTF